MDDRITRERAGRMGLHDWTCLGDAEPRYIDIHTGKVYGGYASELRCAPAMLAALEAMLAPNQTPETYDAAIRLTSVARAKARGTA